MKVTILWGLPGSGKTTWAKSQKGPQRRSNVAIVDVDQLVRHCESHPGRDLFHYIASEVESYSHYKRYENCIIDGLVTTNEQAKNIILAIQGYPDSFEIIFWKKDIEACLHNDRGRRSLKSTISIENLPFEEPSKELIDEFKIKVTKMNVYRKPNWKVWAQENGLSDDPEMKSESWSLGGTWANCWGNSGAVSASPQPETFKEFDTLLEKVCPNISFLQYRKIYGGCVKTKTYTKGDYYGGSVEYCQYVCDVEKLYNELINTGLIKTPS